MKSYTNYSKPLDLYKEAMLHLHNISVKNVHPVVYNILLKMYNIIVPYCTFNNKFQTFNKLFPRHK